MVVYIGLTTECSHAISTVYLKVKRISMMRYPVRYITIFDHGHRFVSAARQQRKSDSSLPRKDSNEARLCS